MSAPYPVKKHTRTVSADFFEHIFDLFDQSLTSTIILGLQNKFSQTVTLIDFMAIPPDEFSLLEYTGSEGTPLGLSRAEIRLMKNIHSWVHHEGYTCSGTDFG